MSGAEKTNGSEIGSVGLVRETWVRVGIMLAAALSCILLSCGREELPVATRGGSPVDSGAVMAAAPSLDAGQDRTKPSVPTVEALFGLGDSLREAARYDSAISVFRRAGELAIAQANDSMWMRCRNEEGYALRLSGKRTAAESLLVVNQAEAERRYTRMHPEYARALSYRTDLVRLRGDYDAALAGYLEVLRIQETTAGISPVDVGRTLNNVGLTYKLKGDFERAIEYFDSSLAVRERLVPPQPKEVAKVLINLGAVYYSKGDLKESERFNLQALDTFISSQEPNFIRAAIVVLHLASIYKKTNDLEKAVRFLRFSKDIYLFELGNKHPKLAPVYNNLATNLRKLNKTAEAIDNLNKAIEIRRIQNLDHPNIGGYYWNLGLCYLDLNYFEKAVQAFEIADSILSNHFETTHPIYFGYQIDKGKLLYNKPSTAQKHYLDLLALAKQHSSLNTRQNRLNILSELAALYLRTNNYSEAQKYNEMALDELLVKTDRRLQWRKNILDQINLLERINFAKDLQELQVVSLTENKNETCPKLLHRSFYDVALRYKAIFRILDDIQTQYDREISKFWVGERRFELVEPAIEFAIMGFNLTGDSIFIKDAFHFSEQSKARILQERIMAKKNNQRLLPETIWRKEDSLRLKVHDYEHVLYRMDKRNYPLRNKVIVQSHAIKTEVELAKFLMWKREQYPLPEIIKTPLQTASPEEMVNYLKELNGNLIQFHLGQKKLHIFLYKPNSLSYFASTNSDTIKTLVFALKQSIEDQDYYEYVKNAELMYTKIFLPVEPHLSSKRLVIIPDGVLNYISFESLLSQNVNASFHYRIQKFLIHEYSFGYGYSATLLANIQKANKHRKLNFGGFAPIQ